MSFSASIPQIKWAFQLDFLCKLHAAIDCHDSIILSAFLRALWIFLVLESATVKLFQTFAVVLNSLSRISSDELCVCLRHVHFSLKMLENFELKLKLLSTWIQWIWFFSWALPLKVQKRMWLISSQSIMGKSMRKTDRDKWLFNHQVLIFA